MTLWYIFFLLLVGVMYKANFSSCTQIWYCLCMYVDLCEVRLCTVYVYHVGYRSITEHSQSVKDIDSQFKSYLCVADPGHRKPVIILPNGLSKARERARDRNKFLSWVGFEPTTS